MPDFFPRLSWRKNAIPPNFLSSKVSPIPKKKTKGYSRGKVSIVPGRVHPQLHNETLFRYRPCSMEVNEELKKKREKGEDRKMEERKKKGK
jgi:hypothetical protein